MNVHIYIDDNDAKIPKGVDVDWTSIPAVGDWILVPDWKDVEGNPSRCLVSRRVFHIDGTVAIKVSPSKALMPIDRRQPVA